MQEQRFGFRPGAHLGAMASFWRCALPGQLQAPMPQCATLGTVNRRRVGAAIAAPVVRPAVRPVTSDREKIPALICLTSFHAADWLASAALGITTARPARRFRNGGQAPATWAAWPVLPLACAASAAPEQGTRMFQCYHTTTVLSTHYIVKTEEQKDGSVILALESQKNSILVFNMS